MNNPRTTSFRLLVEGAAACFRRPEFTHDFISYDVMPPFVAIRILGSLYMPDAARWYVRYIEVLKPIRFKQDRISGARQERRAMVLDDVEYVIAADLVGAADDVDHRSSFAEAIAANPSIHLGLASFPGTAHLVDDNSCRNQALMPVMHDLGWMLYEIRDPETKLPKFFRAQLRDGRVDLSGDLLIAV